MAKTGRKLKWETGEDLLNLWQEYCDWIAKSNYKTLPTQTSFCRWLAKNYESCERKTIYNALNKHFPEIKRSFEQIQSDTMVEGTALGFYQPSMSIFALKNWCKWTDKQEVAQDTKLEIILPAEVDKYAT